MILIPGYTPDDFCQGDNYDAARVLQKAHAQEHGETLLYDHHGDIIPSPEAMAKAIRYANHKRSLSALAGLKAFDRMRPGGDSDFSDPETLGTQAGDLITDLMHLLTLHLQDPEAVIESARQHFEAENVGPA
jgi:hypothetical protein